jgi:hypothetical protein
MLSFVILCMAVMPTHTFAFASICQVNSVNYNYPDQVEPSQQFSVSASLSVTCPQTDNYHFSARLDAADSDGRVLASNFTQEAFLPNNGKPFTIKVSDNLVAPATPEEWTIKLFVYTFVSVDPANGLDFETASTEIIQVGLATAQQTSNSTMLVAPATSTNPLSQTLAQTQSSQTIYQSAAQSSPSTEIWAAYLVVLIAALLIVTFVLLKLRRSG